MVLAEIRKDDSMNAFDLVYRHSWQFDGCELSKVCIIRVLENLNLFSLGIRYTKIRINF
jgi:hypothetical protein